MSIAENVSIIKENIAKAALAAGRDPKEILLCAASKMNDADRVQEAVQGGVDCCGENRVQELTDKLPKGARITHVNSNDGTIEGLAYEGGVSRSVQFYPDAGRGLYKSVDLYDEFIAALRIAK